MPGRTPHHYLLTGGLRRKLKRPMGVLLVGKEIGGERLLEAARSAAMVITVGDRVTETLEEFGRTPDIQVVDGMEMRVPREAPATPYRTLLKAKNPAGVITTEALKAIRVLFRSRKPARLLIEGEEDLLAIPVMMNAPIGAVVYYGQPKLGVVMILVDEKKRMAAKRHLAEMKPVY